MELIQRPIAKLKPHPVLRDVPELPDDHPDFLRLVESIRDEGCLSPINITPAGLVVDGRHRVRALRAIDPEGSVWCLTVPEDRASELALESLVSRRHLVTKGQLAYVAFPLFAPAYNAMVERKSERLRSGIRGTGIEGGVESLCEQLGVARNLFFQAAKVHAIFAEDPELRAEWEPKILDTESPVGLGAVISGIAGAKATRGASRGPTRNTSLARWDVSWGELGKHSKAWERWSADERDHAAQRVRDTVAVLPDPLLDVLRDALRAARRSRNQQEGA